ncbi:MAG TPA: NAD(P)/FAD-dependent oxidoreductase [Spirochaetales bacterium]|jgi:nitrite reductase (NADH) large subunit|nr:NAD(P)/FAD-dependent oxidoreductase [Spirochaetales bacterium]
MHIVIIGNGVAGATVAQKLSNKGVGVTLFAEEPYGFYSRIMLPHSLYDKEALSHLISDNDPPYLVKKPVTAIFPEEKQVATGDGERYPYDKLIIATGSRSRTLDIFSKTDGVCTLRTFYDAQLIGDTIRSPVVVLGGGLLGLETALSLKKKDFDVTVCEAADRILVRQLDKKASAMLRNRLEEKGLIIREGVRTIGKRLDSWEKLAALEVEGEDEIPCRTLILSLGVSPEITLAKEAGLRTRKGVLVDEYLRTSDEDIFAIGDCAEYEGQIPGIVPVALAMAETVIANLTGGDKSYEEPVLFTRFKDDELTVISIGDVSGEALKRVSGDRYEAYFLKDGNLIGAILYGSTEHLKFVRTNYQKGVSEEQISSLLDF